MATRSFCDKKCRPFVELRGAFTQQEQRRALAALTVFEDGSSQSFTIIPYMIRETQGSSKDYHFSGSSSHLTGKLLTEIDWLIRKMLSLATAADKHGGWELSQFEHFEQTDELIFNRFGPAFTDGTFEWHEDDSDEGPRELSVVAYFTEPCDYTGGVLEMQLPDDLITHDPQCATPLPFELVASTGRNATGNSGSPILDDDPRNLTGSNTLPSESMNVSSFTKCDQQVRAGSNALKRDASSVVQRRFSAGDVVAFPSKVLRHRVTPVTRGERRSLLLLCSGRCPGTSFFRGNSM